MDGKAGGTRRKNTYLMARPNPPLNKQIREVDSKRGRLYILYKRFDSASFGKQIPWEVVDLYIIYKRFDPASTIRKIIYLSKR